MKKSSIYSTIAAISLMASLSLSCQDYMAGKLFQVWEGKMIDEYVGENADLSMFYEVIVLSDYEGMLHGYGSYTCFAPNNKAMEKYLQEQGKYSVQEMSKAEANRLIEYHVIRDSIATAEFEDGRLLSPTISGSYLTSKTESDDLGNVWIRMNRQARLIVCDFSAGNGIVHTCDAVMSPSTLDVFATLESYPDSLFSIMKHLMKYSSYSPDSVSARISAYGSDSLATDWLTMFVQDNQSFMDLNLGIENLDLTDPQAMDSVEECLLVRLHENQKSIDDDGELLKQFADYHLAPSLNYVADLLKASSMLSCVTNQIISIKRDVDELILNYFVIGSTIEPGVALHRESDYSDRSASNGVVQYIGGLIEVKNRSSYRVNWDMADQPEIMALKNFRSADGSYTAFANGSLSGVKWGGPAVVDIGYQQYTNYGNGFDEKVQYVYGDAMRFEFMQTRNSWFEWKLPLLVEGTYKVWVCWRREQLTTFRAIFRQEGKDDQVLPYVFDLSVYMNTSQSHEERLQTGWKQYNAKKICSVVNSALLGTIVVESTGEHSMRFENLTYHNGQTSWDMIQFIPVDDDQVWPMMDIKGKLIYQDTPDCEIWPYTYKVSNNYQGDCTWE